jgi:hypothetical protein
MAVNSASLLGFKIFPSLLVAAVLIIILSGKGQRYSLLNYVGLHGGKLGC